MEYKTIFSSRRTVCIQITKDCHVVVRAPKGCSKIYIQRFVEKHHDWIDKKLAQVKKKRLEEPEYTPEQIEQMRIRAKKEILPRVKFFSEKFGLYPTNVKITSAKTRYGSCSGKNSVCFSLYLMAQSKDFVDKVILHELAHIKYKNHSKDFYAFLDYLEKNK